MTHLTRLPQPSQPSARTPRRIPHPPKRPKAAGGVAKTLCNYRLEETVGYGAWGKVKRGWDTDADRPVAVKILVKKRLARKLRDGISRLYREYELLQTLDHPNIVRYYDLIETDYPDDNDRKESNDALHKDVDASSVTSSPASLASFHSPSLKDGKLYLVMEWLGRGCNLHHWIRTHAGHEDRVKYLRTVQVILKQLLAAIVHLRLCNISHHDIKLENVIFDGEKLTLIDFGVAEACPEDASFCPYGTPAYQPPELVLRSDPAIPISGHKADMWSFGVVAYQLARDDGTLPFEADSIYGVFDRIVHAEPDYSAIREPTLRDFLSRLLVKDPQRRMTAQEAAEHAFLQTSPECPADDASSWLHRLCRLLCMR